ncbi:hypothetical protein [Erythrobacter sp. F6033]|uniref:hypothetical protein n=1 Tax=Erythrobacter sp. F6033 TaxID=2926401 RepID=UPI001FF442A1|nr:hypothetical protein [Erythrobacter sp. F6033]MCK0127600.1 hypothetical protein [Erythrobacter sp. F6033]
MRILRPLLAATSAVALFANSAALADEPSQAEATVAQTAEIAALPLTFSENGFAGPGASLLRDDLQQAQFVMIGEAHGHAEAPLLVSAFASETQAYDFRYYAVEVGPYSAEWLQQTLLESGEAGLAEELSGRPLAIPFLNSVEEARAAAAFAQSGGLWGVDQEFIGSPLIHLEILSNMESQNPALVKRLEQTEREAFASGNQGAVLFATIAADGWQELRDAFTGNLDALDRIAAMERSQSIYQSFFMGRGLDNNLDRVELIRRNFLRQYQSAAKSSDAAPRVLMKFGLTHGGRATSSMSTFDLGSLIEGMAASNGLEALHIAYLPIGGTATAIMPSPDGAFSEKPVSADELRSLLVDSAIDLEMIESSEGHFVIDLEPIKRKLGNAGLAELEPMTRFLVLGFDYLVTTSSATAAKPLAPR